MSSMFKAIGRAPARRSAFAAICAMALVGAVLVPGASAGGHHKKGKHHHPAGAVKLPASKIKHVKGVVCGQIGRKWLSGSIVAGYFVSDSQQVRNYTALAKRAKGKAKAQASKQAKKYSARAKAGEATCNPRAGGHRGLPVPPSNPTPTPSPSASSTPTPLRFNIGNAVGLALTSGTAGSTHHLRGGAATSAGETGSNLEAINAGGQVADAVSSGTAEIGNFLIAPNEKLYVMFKRPVDLSDTTKFPTPGSGCILAQVDPESGTPTCIDSSLMSVYVSQANIYDVSPAVQFDSSGAIYYLGYTTGGLVLRKWSNGVTTDLVPPAAVGISSWYVYPNGTVLISGETTATGQKWLRRISPSGSLKELGHAGGWWMVPFPDGHAYTSVQNNGYPGVDYFDEGADALSSKWWIGGPMPPEFQPSGGYYYDVSSICQNIPTTSLKYVNFCQDNGSGIKWHFASEGKEFVLASQQYGKGVPMEYYPSVSFLPTTDIANVTVAQGVIDNLLFAGTNSSGEQVLTMFNTASNTEQQLLGPPTTADQFEIYHLNYVANGNKILFDGLRFSDNHYVIGEYDLSTHTVNVVATSSAKWSDLQSF